ncbi:MAG: carboxypeptidase regulatory-like domain-containing protein [Anaerolineae bacterium]
MPGSDRCSMDLDTLADWLAGLSASADAEAVAAHVVACPACRVEVETLRRLTDAVRTVGAERAGRLVVPSYRAPAPRRDAVRIGVGRSWRRAIGPIALARLVPTLRVAAGLAAAVALVAAGTAGWPAAGRLPSSVRIARPAPVGAPPHGPRAADIDRARPLPTVVVRRPTIVARQAAAALAATALPDGSHGVARVAAVSRGSIARADGSARASSSSNPPANAAEPLAPPGAVVPDDRRRTGRSSPRATDRPRPTDASGSGATAPAPATDAPPTPAETSGPPPAPTIDPTASAPTPPPTGQPTAQPVVPTIAGLVLGGDGRPLAGALVVAEPFEGGAPIAAATGADGRYAIVVAAGRWLVRAEAAGYALMWHGGLPSPLRAEPVAVGEGSAAVEFALEPAPDAAIRGRVVDGEGRGVAGALVAAVRPGDGPTAAPRRRPCTAAATAATRCPCRPAPGWWRRRSTGARARWRGGAATARSSRRIEWGSTRARRSPISTSRCADRSEHVVARAEGRRERTPKVEEITP